MHAVVAVLASFQFALPLPAHGAVRDSSTAAFRDSVEASILRFFYQWGEAWRVAEAARHPIALVVYPERGEQYPFRRLNASCVHTLQGGREADAIGGRQIPSRAGLHSACPSWYVDSGPMPTDERFGIDAALLDRSLPAIQSARRAILLLLDSLARRDPADEWTRGQRVRFFVDQGDHDAALAVVRPCTGAGWWCEMLAGYVLSARDSLQAAEAAFDRGLSEMPPVIRCRWTDWSALIDPDGREAYTRMTCGERDSINRKLWWLADPLFMGAGNERRVVQLARQVFVSLRSALERDERFDWRASAGGDARGELVERYGWPAYVYWPGYGSDIVHASYLADDRGGAHLVLMAGEVRPWYKVPGPLSEPATTYEYPRDQIHLVPTWRALLNPFDSESDDWTLADPATMAHRAESFRGFGRRRALVRPLRADSIVIMTMRWWPTEHTALSHPVVQVRDGQVAILRRQNQVLVASATDLVSSEVRRAPQSNLHASLVASHGADSVAVVAQRNASVGTPLVIHGLIAPRPTIVGVEIPPDVNGPAARTRFGIRPPSALAAFGPDSVAVSDPVLLRALDGDRRLPTHPDSALELMATSLQVDSGKTIAVYWETYGFKPRDTVTISVWIERYTPQGVARRIRIALGLAEDLNTPVVVQWREPMAGRSNQAIDGPVPIVGRSVALDVSQLPRGDYWLDVAVERSGQDAVRGRRGFAIR
jgi:hypothetical protein